MLSQPHHSSKRDSEPRLRRFQVASASADELNRSSAFTIAQGVRRGDSRPTTHPKSGKCRMNPRARFVGQFPLGAATIVLTGTVLTGLSLTTRPSDAQVTREAATAGSGVCVGDNGGITLSP